MKLRLVLIIFLFMYKLPAALAQDSTLLAIINDSMQVAPIQDRPLALFKATQLINLPTTESPDKNVLQFLIMHRFGRINEGGYELFGLDNATIRFGLDYGISKRFSIGVGRSSFEKVYDASLKLHLLQQTEKSPLAITLVEQITYTTQKFVDKPYLNSRLRTAYASQLLLAKNFAGKFSLLLVPTWLHFNLVPAAADKNDIFSLGIGSRIKLTNRISLNTEYIYTNKNQIISYEFDRPFSVGVDIETGGHVFQLVFTNAQGMVAPYYTAKTTGTWGKGDIYFGFNISRVFHFR